MNYLKLYFRDRRVKVQYHTPMQTRILLHLPITSNLSNAELLGLVLVLAASVVKYPEGFDHLKCGISTSRVSQQGQPVSMMNF